MNSTNFNVDIDSENDFSGSWNNKNTQIIASTIKRKAVQI